LRRRLPQADGRNSCHVDFFDLQVGEENRHEVIRDSGCDQILQCLSGNRSRRLRKLDARYNIGV
jgi:hypothetical protein